MGKKKGRKKRRNKRYSKSQFVDIICRHCSLCDGYPDPTFCYKEMYMKNPEIFMNSCYIQLMNASVWLENNTIFNADSVSVQKFKEIFCHSGICGGKRIACEDVLVCYELFKYQIKGIDIFHGSKKKRKRRKPKDSSYIFEAYPTFFLSNNEEWRNEVEGILNDGN